MFCVKSELRQEDPVSPSLALECIMRKILKNQARHSVFTDDVGSVAQSTLHVRDIFDSE